MASYQHREPLNTLGRSLSPTVASPDTSLSTVPYPSLPEDIPSRLLPQTGPGPRPQPLTLNEAWCVSLSEVEGSGWVM